MLRLAPNLKATNALVSKQLDGAYFMDSYSRIGYHLSINSSYKLPGVNLLLQTHQRACGLFAHHRYDSKSFG